MTIWRLVTLLGLVAAAALPAAPQGQARCRVTYVANAGVLFESGSVRFLIDAPIRDGIPP